MGTFLIDGWLAGLSPLSTRDAASVAVAREHVRAQARALGFSDSVTGSLVNVVSELGHNQLAHARHGFIATRPIVRDHTPGLEIIAADEGPGIENPRAALYPRAHDPDTDPLLKRSLGVGLAAMREHADETDFDVRIGEGTCVWARKFAEPLPRAPEVGIYGRPCPGEDVSGDHAGFVRSPTQLTLGLADGLGHGPFARQPARIAIDALCEQADGSFESLFAHCHAILAGTRGTVLTTARLDLPSGALETVSIGNVEARLCGPKTQRRFAGRSFVLGAPGALPKLALERGTRGAHDAFILFTDGVSARFDLESEHDLLREHPLIIAHALVSRFGRNNDDATVLVAR